MPSYLMIAQRVEEKDLPLIVPMLELLKLLPTILKLNDTVAEWDDLIDVTLSVIEQPSTQLPTVNFDWNSYISAIQGLIALRNLDNPPPLRRFLESVLNQRSLLLEMLAESLSGSFRSDLRRCILKEQGIDTVCPPLTKGDVTYNTFVRDRFTVIQIEGTSYFITGSLPFGVTDKERRGIKQSIEAIYTRYYPHAHKIVIPGYFEGGNTLFLPQRDGKRKPLFLHGMNPVGFYYSEGHSSKQNPYLNGEIPRKKFRWNQSVDPRDSFFKISPDTTTQNLANALNDIGVKTIGVKLNQSLIDSSKIHPNIYYHLDCFCHVLPDGRLLVLNQKMLAPESLCVLKNAGVTVVDLAYSGYLYGNASNLFNGISFYQDGKIKLIIPGLSEDVQKCLGKVVGIELIVPHELDLSSESDVLYSKEVDSAMSELGYAIDPKTHKVQPIKSTYEAGDGSVIKLPDALISELATFIREDKWGCIKNYRDPFIANFGSLHCLTQELPDPEHQEQSNIRPS